MIFSNVFLPILHNIGLYIYTIRYKPGIKIPEFLQNIFKKKFKTFELISFFKKQKKKIHAYGRILKCFPSIFSLKDKK